MSLSTSVICALAGALVPGFSGALAAAGRDALAIAHVAQQQRAPQCPLEREFDFDRCPVDARDLMSDYPRRHSFCERVTQAALSGLRGIKNCFSSDSAKKRVSVIVHPMNGWGDIRGGLQITRSLQADRSNPVLAQTETRMIIPQSYSHETCALDPEMVTEVCFSKGQQPVNRVPHLLIISPLNTAFDSTEGILNLAKTPYPMFGVCEAGTHDFATGMNLRFARFHNPPLGHAVATGVGPHSIGLFFNAGFHQRCQALRHSNALRLEAFSSLPLSLQEQFPLIGNGEAPSFYFGYSYGYPAKDAYLQTITLAAQKKERSTSLWFVLVGDPLSPFSSQVKSSDPLVSLKSRRIFQRLRKMGVASVDIRLMAKEEESGLIEKSRILLDLDPPEQGPIAPNISVILVPQLPHHHMLTLNALAEPIVLSTGDHFLTETVTCDNLPIYEQLPHKEDLGVEFADTATAFSPQLSTPVRTLFNSLTKTALHSESETFYYDDKVIQKLAVQVNRWPSYRKIWHDFIKHLIATKDGLANLNKLVAERLGAL